jgi:SPP1 family predicted phage head-tail adaptor
MAINSGRMNRRFVLMKPTTVLNDNGHSISGDDKVVARPWCEVLSNSSTENNGNAVNSQETIIFRIRYSKMLDNPDPSMYILYKDNKYDITSAIDDRDTREIMKVSATRRISR